MLKLLLIIFQLMLFKTVSIQLKHIILELISLHDEESLLARVSREFRCNRSELVYSYRIVKAHCIKIFNIRISQLLPVIWREEVRRSNFYLNYIKHQLNLNDFITHIWILYFYLNYNKIIYPFPHEIIKILVVKIFNVNLFFIWIITII